MIDNSVPVISWKELKLEKLIGNGTIGKVYEGKWKGTTVAVKHLFLKKLSNDLMKEFQEECSRLHRCKFPQITQLFGVCEEEGHYAMVMEFLSKGSLYDVLHDSSNALPWNQRWNIAISIARGLEYLHNSLKIVHSGLKSTNILLESDYSPKITDFGFSTIKRETNKTTANKRNDSVRWMAPELFKRRAQPTFASDVYSFGMILWELTSRKIPFADAVNETIAIDWIVGGQTEDIIQSPEVPHIFNSWIQKCWNTDPKQRPSIISIAISLEKEMPTLQNANQLFKLGEKCKKRGNAQQAVNYYHMAADVGLAAAQFRLAVCYAIGFGVPKDEQQTVKWYQMAADQGHADALCNLGYCYEIGFGVSKDIQQSVKYYKLAADKGHVDAQFNLALCYENGKGVSKDEQQAVKYYEMAAAQGDEDSQHNLGLCYANGEGVAQGNQHAEAQHMLGLHFACNQLFKNEQQAVEYFHLAADQGYPRAQFNLGVCYAIGKGVSKNVKEAVKYYRMAADQRLADAQCNLGYCYEYGEGASKDELQAVKFYRMAADQGHAKAQYNLALCYENGVGVSKDMQQAVKWYQMAADQGYAKAQHNLAGCYAILKDKQQAVKYYKLAADQGLAAAQFQLALCYETGKGVFKDELLAVKYYKLAADQGNADAQLYLALCYENGTGVSKDKQQAAIYYKMAANQGHVDALEVQLYTKNINKIKKEMTL